jgi:hypothetical protein
MVLQTAFMARIANADLVEGCLLLDQTLQLAQTAKARLPQKLGSARYSRMDLKLKADFDGADETRKVLTSIVG